MPSFSNLRDALGENDIDYVRIERLLIDTLFHPEGVIRESARKHLLTETKPFTLRGGLVCNGEMVLVIDDVVSDDGQGYLVVGSVPNDYAGKVIYPFEMNK